MFKAAVAVAGAAVDRRTSGSWPVWTLLVNFMLASLVLCALLPRKWAVRIFKMLNSMSLLPSST
jgi:hypothetical protein